MRSRSRLLLFSVAALACSNLKPGALAQSEVAAPTSPPLTQACTPSGPETCFNARDDNCNGIIDESCGLTTGLIQFVIAWDKPRADVDLYVTDPAGELAEVGHATRSGLIKERDCPGSGNECLGKNLENVVLEAGKDLPHGRFQARVRLENLKNEEPPVHVTLGVRLGSKSYAVDLVLQQNEEQRDFVFEL